MNTTCTTDFMGHFTCSEEISRAVTIFIEPSVKKKNNSDRIYNRGQLCQLYSTALLDIIVGWDTLGRLCRENVSLSQKGWQIVYA